MEYIQFLQLSLLIGLAGFAVYAYFREKKAYNWFKKWADTELEKLNCIHNELQEEIKQRKAWSQEVAEHESRLSKQEKSSKVQYLIKGRDLVQLIRRK